ncbi:unnamed protein product, partial [Iphiclides podalirius]
MLIYLAALYLHPSVLIPSGKGKYPLLKYNNHTFTYKVLSGTGVLWHCSKRTRTGCKAFIKSLPESWDIIKTVYDEHSHLPRSCLTTNTGDGVLIPSGKGKHPLLMYKNQTYTYKVMSSSGVLWHCSRRMRTGCKAFIRSLPDRIDVIKTVYDTHCHTPKLVYKYDPNMI